MNYPARKRFLPPAALLCLLLLMGTLSNAQQKPLPAASSTPTTSRIPAASSLPAASRIPASSLVLENLGSATVPVDGAWQFHPGDDPVWAAPAFDDSQWQRIQTGRTWEEQGHYGYTGFAWYRRHLVLPSGTPSDLQLALFLPAVESACEIYWNGKLVGSVGKLPPHPVWYVAFGEAPGAQARTVFPLGPARSGVLAIRVWQAPVIVYGYPEEGGLVSIPRVGGTEAIAALQTASRYRWLRVNLFALAVALLSFLIGLLILLTWLRNCGRTMLLWLAILLFYPAEYFCFINVPGFLPFRLNYGLIGPAIGLYCVALWFLLLVLLDLDEDKRLVFWTRIFAVAQMGFVLLDGSLQLFDWSCGPAHLFLLGDFASSLVSVLLELWGPVLVLFAFRKRLDATRWFLAISALLTGLVEAGNDSTALGTRWTHWTINERLNATLLTVGGSPLNVRDLTDTLLLVALLYAAWRLSVEQNQRRNALEQEYRSAQELQQVLIPDSFPTLAGYTVASAYRPAQEVGGDFFQLVPLPGNAAILVIGDVSGKGLPAAMAVALIVGAIRSTAEATDDPALMLAALNRRLNGRLRGGFATCLALRLDAQGNCRLANAGHLSPYRNGDEVEVDSGLPLGILPETQYTETTLQLAPGDRLTFLTDGVIEARNHSGELFGFERTRRISAQSADQIAAAAQAFGQEDDITVLTLTFAPA